MKRTKELSPRRQELIDVARAMLDGKMHLIEGVRKMASLRYDIGEPDDPIFHPILAIDSETDRFPLGQVRERYAPDALARIDQEMDRYLADARDDILSACKQIVRAFG